MFRFQFRSLFVLFLIRYLFLPIFIEVKRGQMLKAEIEAEANFKTEPKTLRSRAKCPETEVEAIILAIFIDVGHRCPFSAVVLINSYNRLP